MIKENVYGKEASKLNSEAFNAVIVSLLTGLVSGWIVTKNYIS